MYDNICKYLAEEFSSDIATWLLGEPIKTTQLNPKELSLEPIRTDSLILRQSKKLLLHGEFQTKPDPEIPFRMADYRLRGYRYNPDKEMYQVVVYLRETNSKLVQENTFTLSKMRHEFNVIRLWEQPTELFLDSPGVLPFAVLSENTEKVEVLREVASRIEAIKDRKVQQNVAASAAILAGLVLDKDIIRRILRREIMRESVIYQEIEQEAREKGRQEGRQEGLEEGRQEEREAVALNLLRGGITTEQVVVFTGLSLERVNQLQRQLDS